MHFDLNDYNLYTFSIVYHMFITWDTYQEIVEIIDFVDIAIFCISLSFKFMSEQKGWDLVWPVSWSAVADP
jgi:hypothetical protein